MNKEDKNAKLQVDEQDINYNLEFQIMKKKVEILEQKQEQMRQEKSDLQRQNEKYSQELEVQQAVNAQMKQQIDSLQGKTSYIPYLQIQQRQNIDYKYLFQQLEQLQEKGSKSFDNLSHIKDQDNNIFDANQNTPEQEDNLQDKLNEGIIRNRSQVSNGVPENDQQKIEDILPDKTAFQVLRDQQQRKSFYKPLDRDLKRRMEEIYSTSDSFFLDNGISFDILDTPFYKMYVNRVEKRVENMKAFLKKFTKNLKDLVKNGEIYSQTLKALSKEISLNLILVEDNKELFSMFSYTSEYFKDLTNFFDALNFNLNNLVIAPIKNYCNGTSEQYKDIKKKYQKCQEEYDAIDLKNSQQKKSSVINISIHDLIFNFSMNTE